MAMTRLEALEAVAKAARRVVANEARLAANKLEIVAMLRSALAALDAAPPDDIWRPIGDKPNTDMMVEYFMGNYPQDIIVSLQRRQPNRDERFDLGYFDGAVFREKGTDHEMFESWKDPRSLPTHWHPLPPPPATGDKE